MTKRFDFLQSSNQVITKYKRLDPKNAGIQTKNSYLEQVSVEQWVSSHNNMGFSMTRQVILHRNKGMTVYKNKITQSVHFITENIHEPDKQQLPSHEIVVTAPCPCENVISVQFSSFQLWRQILGCKKHFCTYDDYNWDWQLSSHYRFQEI